MIEMKQQCGFPVFLHSEDCSSGVTVKCEIDHFGELHGTLFLIVIVAGFEFELVISGCNGGAETLNPLCRATCYH
jgi:hypothetical protein